MIPTNLINPLASQTEALDLTTTAQETVAEQNAPVPKAAQVDPNKERNELLRQYIETCKVYRRKLISNWMLSIDFRRGKPFPSQTDDDRIAVNLDWTLTKSKQAALFSQVPKIRISNPPLTLPQAAPWLPKFEHRLNELMVEGGIEAAMDECIPDCINAAGIGAVLVSYEAITEDRQVPSIDLSQLPPEVASQVLQTGQFNGAPIPTETVPAILDKRYTLTRVSPADLLWSLQFTGSNFDNSPWVGRSGRIPWAEAVIKFKLDPVDKDKILGDDRTTMDRLTQDTERDKSRADEMVAFDEIFYKEFQFDADSKSFCTIHHVVFVNGKDVPVIDEPWKGQRLDEEGYVLGSYKYPLRFLTLTYITDETIPPSDSAIGRPQVNEINKARTQMIKQRERSLPIRWFDVNRVDPAIQTGLMRGTWQAAIPVQGEGSRVIGEVARATMPPENFMFYKIAKSDLQEVWTIGPSSQQLLDAKADPEQNGSPFNSQSGKERAKVGAFVVGIAEVLSGLMCLYEEAETFGEGFDPVVSRKLRFNILVDSTVLLDANQKLARMNKFINEYAKSGWINIEPVLQEIATLSGLDPTLVIRPPEPKPPVEPNISLRLTGVEDLLNPLALAFLIKSGQAPRPELIEQAKGLIQQAVTPPFVPQVSPAGSAGQQLFMGAPPAPEGTPGPHNPLGPPLPPQVPGPPPGSPTPPPAPPRIGEANPNWTVMPALNKRSEGNEK